jgi:hypothetical protein
MYNLFTALKSGCHYSYRSHFHTDQVLPMCVHPKQYHVRLMIPPSLLCLVQRWIYIWYHSTILEPYQLLSTPFKMILILY